MECIILSVKELYMDAQEVMHMTDYSKITALYSRLSVGDEDRDGGESNSIQNQKKILQKASKEKGYTGTIFFVDDGITGTTMKRPGFQKMIASIEAGYISAVFVKDLGHQHWQELRYPGRTCGG